MMNKEYLELKKIKPNEANPRDITEDKFIKLVNSLLSFPAMLELRPIVIDNANVILGGNQRYKALQFIAQMSFDELTERIATIKDFKKKKKDEKTKILSYWQDFLEQPKTPILKADTLTDEEKQRFIIEDNTDFGNWNWDCLANEWDNEDLQNWGLDVWNAEEHTEEEENKEIEEDEVPEINTEEEPKSKLGDIYQLGNHRLMCGDSTKQEDVQKLMNREKADMVFTDPPYGMNFQSNMRKENKKFDVLKNDDKILDFFPLLYETNNGFIFICTTWKVLNVWLPLFKKYYNLSNMIIWNKGGGGIGDLTHTFSTDYEIILCCNNDKELIGKRIGSVWNIGRDNTIDYKHPTQKPVALSALAVKETTKENEIVLDLFGGSGSTLIACEQLNRKCFMMELDPHYIDVIIQRWEKLTEKTAIKL